MKNKLKILTTIAFVMLTSAVAFCQEFTVIVPSTIKSHNSLYPTKAGGSIGPFKVSVKNNDTLAWTVSIDKALLGEVEPWVSIENNSLELTAGQQRDFSVTITVPSSALDVNYPMYLWFNGFLNSNHNITAQFFYDQQTIIVDNSLPQTPTFTVSQTSKTVSVYNWISFDTRSGSYTTFNDTSGVDGIKKYKAVIKNATNTVIETSPEVKASENHSYTFQKLDPNTAYKVSVIATDLANNSNTNEVNTTTAPAAPVLSPISTDFCSITLAWTASAGAVGYELYDVTNAPGTLIKNTTATTFTVSGLIAAKQKKYFVKAYNSSNIRSDVSNTLTVSTLTIPVPLVKGPSSVCTSTASFYVTSVPTGCSVAWQPSSNLSLISASGNTASFAVSGNGSAYVTANFITCGGNGAISAAKYTWIGAPNLSGSVITGPTQLTPGYAAVYTISATQGVTSFNWTIPTGCYASYCWEIVTGQNTNSIHIKAGAVGSGNIICTASNSCGTGSRNMVVNVQDPNDPTPCDGLTLNLSPNPSSAGDVVVDVIYPPDPCDETMMNAASATVSVVDNMGNTVYSGKQKENRFELSGLGLKKGIYHLIYVKNNKKFEKLMVVE